MVNAVQEYILFSVFIASEIVADRAVYTYHLILPSNDFAKSLYIHSDPCVKCGHSFTDFLMGFVPSLAHIGKII